MEFTLLNTTFPTDIKLFKVNNGSTKPMSKICSMLTIKTPKRR